MAERRYSTTTVKILFGASGNQCAFPDCTNPIIVPGAEYSDAAVVGHICHIYAVADTGPRGNPNLSEKERNAAKNLMLMCGHHHPMIDKQWADYPAAVLIGWKLAHEAKFQQNTAEALKHQEKMQQNAFLRSLSDQEIDKEIERIRKARYIVGFPLRDEVTTLAARVEKTELAGGSAGHRARALAWCARMLSVGETAGQAHELLRQSRELAPTPEADIAEAFIIAQKNKEQALSKLATIDSPAARSAALRIVTNCDKAEAALAWVQKAGLTLESFDAEGKFYHTMNQLEAGRWNDAMQSAADVSEVDINEAPVLLQTKAVTQLIQAVPEQLRAVAISQVPFEATHFPLSDTEPGLVARRQAISYFDRISEFAIGIGAIGASNDASDHALWLRLRDPSQHERALEVLRSSMRDDKQSLRRVHLALQFGIKLDIEAIEKKIDQNVALAGKGGADEAFARFALAFAKGTPKAVAEYIAIHRKELCEHLQRSAVIGIEIEMLARAGLKDAAEKRLAEEAAVGLGEHEHQHLIRMINEAAGADPATERRKLYEDTGNVTDLFNLVNLLEENEAWQELCPYADKLFSMTHSREDAFRLARCLDRTDQHARLLAFLSGHIAIVEQSSDLKAILAWSLYRDGQFDAAAARLKELAAVRDNPNDRALHVQIAIASGKWQQLAQHTTNEWNNRDHRTARELLAAGQLAQAVGGSHARELVTAAARKAPDDPTILAGAYFHSTNAGWEQDEVTARWLITAAALSGNDGPIKSVSLKDLVDQQPDWNKRQASVWDQLNEGSIPAFGAAYLLNRSLTDLTLLPSLANLNERDPRRRSVVYAYSGARAPASSNAKKVALDLAAIFTLAQLDLLETVMAAYEIVISNSTLGWLFQERQRVTFHQPSRIRDAHNLKRLIAEGALQVLRVQAPPDHALVKQIGAGLADLLLTAEQRTQADKETSRYVIRSSPVHRVGSLLQEEADLTSYFPYLCSCHAVVEKLRAKAVLTRLDEQRALAYLKLHERRWPSEPAIADRAELFLDDLSVSYLRHIGVLGKLQGAGLTTYISEHEDEEANRLIAFEHLSSQQLELVEMIRATLTEGLESGRVRAVRSKSLEQDDSSVKMHPALALFSLDTRFDAFVVDDRFINRFLYIDESNERTPILSTLDVLDDLSAKQLISAESLFAKRTYLRQAGYQLIPVTVDELLHHLAIAPLQDGHIIETAELRAIRESLLKARMSKMLQIPHETPWLHHTTRSLILCIKQLWTRNAEPATASSYSEWLLGLIDSFVNDAPVANVDQFILISALFFAVYGDMSLRRVLSSKPPFWRRLAALAQAAMITRQIIAYGQDAAGLADWLKSVRAQAFVLQCYADMRLEPRWFVELAMPEQLRNELIGRAWLAATANEVVVASQGWKEKLLGEGDGTLISRFGIAKAFLPGPLEGGANAAQEMPLELVDSIHSDLSAPTITASSFGGLVNAAFVYRLRPQLADLAAAAIVRADYHLQSIDPKVPLRAILPALASVAAVSRNESLADALFIVLRKCGRFYPDELSIDDAFRVAMMAAASREKLFEWAKCLGSCMSDLAFQKITPEDAKRLHSHIFLLCHLVPELWSTCGQAEAALQAVLAS